MQEESHAPLQVQNIAGKGCRLGEIYYVSSISRTPY